MAALSWKGPQPRSSSFKRCYSIFPLFGIVLVVLLLRYAAVSIVRQAYERTSDSSSSSSSPGAQAQPNNGTRDPSTGSTAVSKRSLRGRKQLVTPDPHVCIVVRTYWGHGPRGTNGLARMLEFFSGSRLGSWEVLLLVLDSQPFSELPSILKAVGDSRIRVFRQRVRAFRTWTMPRMHACMQDPRRWPPLRAGHARSSVAMAACMPHASPTMHPAFAFAPTRSGPSLSRRFCRSRSPVRAAVTRAASPGMQHCVPPMPARARRCWSSARCTDRTCTQYAGRSSTLLGRACGAPRACRSPTTT